MKQLRNVIRELKANRNLEKAKFVARYFKTGKGEYGEGDKFIGLTVPQMRNIAKKYRDLPLRDVEKLLHNKIHEYRLTALLILDEQFRRADAKKQKEIISLYLRNTKYINNWDLVDLSAHDLLGAYLLNKPRERKILYRLVKSKNIWERRIAIITTYAFLRKKDFADTLAIAEILLHDTHDLIHKAVGWMLREAGKMDEKALTNFLAKHYRVMPRRMLRYAIERLGESKRQWYLGKS